MPKKTAVTLTDTGIKRKRPDPQKRIEKPDAGALGLYLIVQPSGQKSFAVRYRVRGPGYTGKYTIGAYPTYSLEEAREIARGIRKKAEQGIDPSEDQKQQLEGRRLEYAAEKRAAAERASATYEAAVNEFIEKYAKGKKANRTWRETRRILRTNGAGWLERHVGDITRRDVHSVLDAIMAQGKGYAANRACAAFRTFFTWCLSRDKIEHSPMEGVERPFDGERSRERHWTDAEIQSIWKAADRIAGSTGAYLKVSMLTGQRRDEVAGMRWDEFEDNCGVWVLTVQRSKSKREHKFPLSPLAQRIIQAQPRVSGCPFVFPGKFLDRPMNGWTTLKTRVRKHSGVGDFNFHQARHTLRTNLDRLQVPPHVKDECLNHSRRGRGAGDSHYSHYEYLPEQREAFERWAEHVERTVWPESVVGLRG